MKYASIVSLLWLLLSCNTSSEKKQETNQIAPEQKENAAGNSDPGEISFVLNGEKVISRSGGISRSKTGTTEIINILSGTATDTRTLNITVTGTEPGVYLFTDGIQAMKGGKSAFGSFNPNSRQDVMNLYSITNGKFELLSLNAAEGTLSANFTFNAQNTNGDKLSVTEGHISNARITSSY